MKREIGLSAVMSLVFVLVAWTPADSDRHRNDRRGDSDHHRKVSCPRGKVIHSVDFHSRTVDCVDLERILPALEFITVEKHVMNGLAGPHLIITGVNVHIRSGSGATNDNLPAPPLGLGNLVIGYNEDEAVAPPAGLTAKIRGDSHNLVVGSQHVYSSVGGFVAGIGNSVSEPSASVSGGFRNIAIGFGASVSGGFQNTASGGLSSISGGADNSAVGGASSVGGGLNNSTGGGFSAVSGGIGNLATGDYSSVSGGFERTAPAIFNWAAGGLLEPN